MVEVRKGNREVRWSGLMILEFGGPGGRAFRNFRRQGGFKMFMPPMVRYGYFLESLNSSYTEVPFQNLCVLSIAMKQKKGKRIVRSSALSSMIFLVTFSPLIFSGF